MANNMAKLQSMSLTMANSGILWMIVACAVLSGKAVPTEAKGTREQRKQ
jgi:light-regulated signal transduction histidine kinase (bacteriophytochrome)